MDENHTCIHWSEQLGNPYRRGLFPELLHDDIAVKLVSGRRIGMSKSDEDINLQVTFDNDYIVNYLVNRLIRALQVSDGKSLNKLQSLIFQAYRVYKDEQKGLKG